MLNTIITKTKKRLGQLYSNSENYGHLFSFSACLRFFNINNEYILFLELESIESGVRCWGGAEEVCLKPPNNKNIK